MNGEDNPVVDAAIKILDSKPATNLLDPVTKEVGKMLGIVGNVARFYLTDNLRKIFTKWAKSRPDGHTIQAEEIKKIMPLLPLASMVSDDELQARWAALMENAVTDKDYLPAFSQTLSQLTAEEAQFLDRLWKVVSQPTPQVRRPTGREALPHFAMIQVFDPEIKTNINRWQMLQSEIRGELTEEQKEQIQNLEHAELVLQDLERLGLSGREIVEKEGPYLKYEHYKIPTVPTFPETTVYHSLTRLGVSFIRAVTTKIDVPGEDAASLTSTDRP